LEDNRQNTLIFFKILGLQKVNKAGPSCTVTSEAASSSGLKRKATACEQGPSAKTKKKTEWYESVRLNALNSFLSFFGNL
jgi:hypothetical protein